MTDAKQRLLVAIEPGVHGANRASAVRTSFRVTAEEQPPSRACAHSAVAEAGHSPRTDSLRVSRRGTSLGFLGVVRFSGCPGAEVLGLWHAKKGETTPRWPNHAEVAKPRRGGQTTPRWPNHSRFSRESREG